MKEILYNYDNLEENDIDEKVIRTKAFIVNSENEVLLGYSYKTYQFPGGHLEEKENIQSCIKREIKEETGIDIDTSNLEPFMMIKHYTKNYGDKGLNRENDIYYFIIETDEKIDITKTHYDEIESLGNYELVRVRLEDIEQLLTESISDNPINEVIVEEMLEVVQEYKKIKEESNAININI